MAILVGIIIFKNFLSVDVSSEASSLPGEWELWKNDLESFFLAQNVETQRDKRAQLAYLGGPGLQELLRHLPGVNQVPHVSNDPPYYDVAIKSLDDYFEPFRRKTYERHIFHQIVQNPEERFTDFVMRLRKQISRCNYNACVVDELIDDRITQGCKSQELRTKLLQRDRSLEEIVALGTSMAKSWDQSKKLVKPNTQTRPEFEVHSVAKPPFRSFTHRRATNSPGFQYRKQSDRQQNNFNCYGCGRRGHVQGSIEFPAKQTKCAACGKLGHWAKRCYAARQGFKRRANDNSSEPQAKRIRAVQEEIEDGQSKDFVFYAMGRNVFNFKVDGVDIPMTIDSGADANIITRSVWEQMKEAGVNVSDATTTDKQT
ncbi:uncharacterized protein LOC134222788 [Armigeres subalbatus]|uniref:uncharacterized protein LOC134222788 n=1 Tax=Armigeres subalbatus TaxID=124917 RepID=UPI002ED4411C